MASPFKLTPYVFEKWREMAGQGMDRAAMAAYFGLTTTKFKELEHDYPEITDFIQTARARKMNYVMKKLDQRIDQGDLKAIDIYLKAQAKDYGYAEEGVDKKLSTTLTLNTTDPIEAAKIYQKIMQGA